MTMDDASCFCCQNPACSLYGRRDAGNLSVRDRYGKAYWDCPASRPAGKRARDERAGRAHPDARLRGTADAVLARCPPRREEVRGTGTQAASVRRQGRRSADGGRQDRRGRGPPWPCSTQRDRVTWRGLGQPARRWTSCGSRHSRPAGARCPPSRYFGPNAVTSSARWCDCRPARALVTTGWPPGRGPAPTSGRVARLHAAASRCRAKARTFGTRGRVRQLAARKVRVGTS
jgi:hypothetical protein